MYPSLIYYNQPVSRQPELNIFQWQFIQLHEWHVEFPIRPFWRIYWNKTPGARIISGSRTFELIPENIILIPPFTPYQVELENPVNHFFIHFMPGQNIPKLIRKVTVLSCPQLLLKIIESIKTENQEFCIFALVCSIIADCPQTDGDDGEGSIDKRIQKVLKMMDSLPRNLCSNAKLASAANMATSSFQHLFQKELGIAPQKYLNNIQMEQARLLLSSTDLPISEIAEQLGFANRYHFSTVFSNSNQAVSPAAYRKKFRKQ